MLLFVDYSTIVLNKLTHEWLNFEDHEAQAWIGLLQAERAAEQRAALDRDECQWWRTLFTKTREEFIRLSSESWSSVFALIVRTSIDQPKRIAGNPTWLAANLRLLDTRPVPYTHLERMFGVQQGHTYRTLLRGGVEWRVKAEGLKFALEQQEDTGDNRFYAAPANNQFLVRGKVIHTKVFDLTQIAYNPQPPLPQPPREAALGHWWRQKYADTRMSAATLERRLRGLNADFTSDEVDALMKLAKEEGLVK